MRSVAYTPRVQEVSYHDGYVNLTCVVSFPGGSSYTTAATIRARSYQVAGYNFQFDEPGPLDITTAPLPRPTLSRSAASASLFYDRNLRPVIEELSARFPSNQLILSMAIYPGELEAVIGAGGEGRLVTAHASGALTVGPPTEFEGERSGIEIPQLNPSVPERLVKLIAARGGVPIGGGARHALIARHYPPRIRATRSAAESQPGRRPSRTIWLASDWSSSFTGVGMPTSRPRRTTSPFR